MKTTLKCKLHGYTHMYTVCHCGHQYCAQVWAGCPRGCDGMARTILATGPL